MSAFVDRHRGFNLGVDGGQITANVDRHQFMRDESHFVKREKGGRSGHDDERGMKTWVWSTT